MPIPVAARSKAYVCDISLAGIAGSNSAGDIDISVVSVVCDVCVEVSATIRSLVLRSPTECGVMAQPHRRSLGPLGLSSRVKRKRFCWKN